jgi:hypothetical protein
MTPVIPYLLMLCLSLSSFLAYVQSCEGTLGTNLITGGDFGSGSATILSGIPNTSIEAGDTLQLSISSTVNDLSYQWSGDGQASCDTCANTNWLVLPGGQLRVIVNNQQGCGVVIDTLLEVFNPYRVYQPNAFSPNGDGDSDFFILGLGTNAKAISSLAIFDRWGRSRLRIPYQSPATS